MTTGEPLVVRGWMKPLPTLTKPLRSVDIATHEPAEALRERTDSSTVPRPAWSERRWSRSCSPTPTGGSSAATTSTTCEPRSSAYEQRIDRRSRMTGARLTRTPGLTRRLVPADTSACARGCARTPSHAVALRSESPVVAWLGLSSWEWTDYDSEARPAIDALLAGHISAAS